MISYNKKKYVGVLVHNKLWYLKTYLFNGNFTFRRAQSEQRLNSTGVPVQQYAPSGGKR